MEIFYFTVVTMLQCGETPWMRQEKIQEDFKPKFDVSDKSKTKYLFDSERLDKWKPFCLVMLQKYEA